ncbi:hypothetical protein HanPI659440_Chr07g0257191 [Helianthus annuus]|nr:hypothetical protein HanPI659440_Chr07g0257191 [Helianthus annuus]
MIKICMIYPAWCKHMTRSDEVIPAIPSDVADTLWGTNQAPTNVLLCFEDGRSFTVIVKEAKGKFFAFRDGLKLFCVIPEVVVNYYVRTSTDVGATIFIANKMFDVKIQRIGDHVGFTKGLDVVVDQFLLGGGCYLVFTKLLGNFYRMRVFGKKKKLS